MRILITGATGFIGKILVQKLSKKYELSCLIRPTSDISELKKQKVKLLTGDLLDKGSLIKATEKIEIVIHLATSHSSGKEKTDVSGSTNLIEACKKNKIKQLIFISSLAVKRKNLDDYGKAKLQIEENIKQSGLSYTILRPGIIYSKNNLSLIGMSLLSLPLIIPIIGNGKYKLAPAYITDLIQAIENSLSNKKAINKTYDVASQPPLSFNEILTISKLHLKIKKISLHIPISLCIFVFKLFPIISIEAVKGINQDTTADITGLKKDLNLIPLSFKEGIKNVNL